MFKRRPRLTYANVMATLAFFAAVTTGGAYAASTIGSADIIDDSIQSVDVKNGQVKTDDIAPDAIGTGRIADKAVSTPDLNTDAVTTDKIKAGNVGAADLADNSVTSAKVPGDALTGSDVKESSLNLNGFFAATSTSGSCNADGGALTACASTGITLPRAGRVLAGATGSWQTFAFDGGSTTDDTTLVRGRCQFAVDGTTFGLSQTMGERQQSGVAANHPPDAPGTVALTALSNTLAAGVHTFEIDCAEEDADLDWRNLNLSLALVDDSGTAPAGAAPAVAGHPDLTRSGKRAAPASGR